MRLEPTICIGYVPSFKFQFHKGAIRTLSYLQDQMISHLFQFHKGAIRTMVNGGSQMQKINFNSIKVRLEQPKKVLNHRIEIFQFHKGAIRT